MTPSPHTSTLPNALRTGVLALVFLLPLLLLTNCSRTVSSPAGEYIPTGQASWYGPGFHGKMTANGEIFDENALTAAHKTLRFNTRVRVTNLETGKSIVVRINDRFPNTKGRIIDLSKASFGQIANHNQGVIPVRLEVLQ